MRHPERFAALAPMVGYFGWPPSVPENIRDLADVPVWAFHGAKDNIIPMEEEQILVDTLKDCGGDAQFTIFPDVGYDLSSDEPTMIGTKRGENADCGSGRHHNRFQFAVAFLGYRLQGR